VIGVTVADMIIIVKWIIILAVIREILAYLFHWDADWFGIQEFIENRRHNAAITEKWHRDGEPIVSTTVGWRRDPINGEDGYRFDGYDQFGTPTYSKLLRGGTKEYREKFNKDVEESKRHGTLHG
jgi:hypothetical protein